MTTDTTASSKALIAESISRALDKIMENIGDKKLLNITTCIFGQSLDDPTKLLISLDVSGNFIPEEYQGMVYTISRILEERAAEMEKAPVLS